MDPKKEKKNKVEEEVLEDIEVEDEDSQDHALFNEKMQSRFYRKDFPEEGDLVIVRISKAHDDLSLIRCIDLNH
jgi:hypothetical protein